MASIEKFTDKQMCQMLRHNNREILESSNPDIIPPDEMEKMGKQNYSFPLDHGDLKDYKYYKKLTSRYYLYGRGTLREDKAVTGFGLVVTAPLEIQGDNAKERAFFEGVLQFAKDRYGEEHIINNAVHLDEAGGPHIHIIICPVTELDHDRVKYKTVKTKQALKMESGRYEYKHVFKLDDSGERIPVKNYDKVTDYYDMKISANDVLNKIEMTHLHPDLQKYLSDHGIEGRIITGKTGGINFSIKELKEFTKITGLHLKDVKEIMGDRSMLLSIIEQHSKIKDMDALLSEKNAVIQSLRDEILARDKSREITKLKEEILHKDNQIRDLSKAVSDKDRVIAAEMEKNASMQQKLAEKDYTIAEKQKELELANQKIKELETEKQRAASEMEKDRDHGWGHEHEGWGGNSHNKGWERTNEVQHTW